MNEGAFISMTCVNGPEFFTRLRDVVMEDYTPLWPYAARPLRNALAEQFAMRGATGAHGAWAPLNVRYLERKFRKWGEQPIEVASGAMRDALLSDDAFTYEPRRMTYGPRDPRLAEIAYYQQTGFRTRAGQTWGARLKRYLARKRGKEVAQEFVPARRLFDFSREVVQDVARALAAGYVVICRRRGYAMWQEGMAVSEAPLQQISAAEARIAGKAAYAAGV